MILLLYYLQLHYRLILNQYLGSTNLLDSGTIKTIIDDIEVKYEQTTTFKLASNINYKVTKELSSISFEITSDIKNSSCAFSTSSRFSSSTITIPNTFKINKPIEFQASKSYLVAVDNNIILWTEVTSIE